jgi:hypothetical protein
MARYPCVPGENRDKLAGGRDVGDSEGSFGIIVINFENLDSDSSPM